MKMHLIEDSMGTFEFLRPHLSSLPSLARFVVRMSAIFVMPGFSRRLELPSVVGLLVAGIILGPTCWISSAKDGRWRIS
jgi:hypothetical protein